MTNKEDLWKTFEDLTEEEFKNLKWFLKENDAEKGFAAIPESRLQKADRLDTVDLMVQKYGTVSEALQKSTEILEKIHRNDLVQRLSNTISGQRDLKKLDSGQSSYGFEEQKAKLREVKAEMGLMIQERRNKIREIQRSAELSRRSAGQQVKDSIHHFQALVQSVNRSLDHLIEEIEIKQKKTQKDAEGILRDLEQEISDLTQKEAELEKLLTAEKLNLSQRFLDRFLDNTKNRTEVAIPQPSYKDNVKNAVDKLKENLNKEMEKFLSKAELNRTQQFEVDVTLDPNTAHPSLVLSEDGRRVYCGNLNKNLPDHPERFSRAANVLGKQRFSSGRFYFELQVKGKTSWDLGVVKESIVRKESVDTKPESGYWTIGRRGDEYKTSTGYLRVKPPVDKVGVLVDYEQGFVLFYNVDFAEIIHCFTDCCFEEKLRPFFSPGLHRGGSNSTPLVISPVSYVD